MATNRLIDFLQGASNAAASNVSAPVDGLDWLLRKAGVPVGDTPMGGSDWMRAKGLTAEPQNRLAGIMGESLGGVAPMLAAAKAPQIASALLKGGENLRAPATMNPQTGAVVWHGSPHKFDAFDSGKIGTGEGNQSFGHGVYLSDSTDVAKTYLVAGQVSKASDRPTEMVARAIDASGGDESAAKLWLKNRLDTSPSEFKGIYSTAINGFDSLKPQGSSIYKVDLPDEHIAKMLDYDNAIPEAIRKPLSSAALDEFGSGFSNGSGEQLMKTLAFEFKQQGHPNPNAAASEWLAKKGVPGVRYLDGGSRGAGAGTSNYVIFPGNENLLQILERNGQTVNKLSGLIGK